MIGATMCTACPRTAPFASWRVFAQPDTNCIAVGGTRDEEVALRVAIGDAELKLEPVAAAATDERPSGQRLIARNDRREPNALVGRDSRRQFVPQDEDIYVVVWRVCSP
jgi:hypothetical protein